MSIVHSAQLRTRTGRAPDGLFAAILASLALLFAAAAAAGCSTTSAVGYNTYSSPGGRPTVLQTAEGAMDFAEGALDNLDRRIENAGY